MQVITNVIDYGMSLNNAVNRPRLHYQGIPERVLAEPRAITPKTFRGLKLRGYRILPFMTYGAAESISVAADGTMLGVNDNRKPAGKAIAY